MKKSLVTLCGIGLVSMPPLAVSGKLSLPDLPMASGAGVEPNVMLLFDSSGSMGRTFIDPNTNRVSTRIQVAKEVATKLIDETEGIRFCLARFRALYGNGRTNNTEGGHVLNACSSATADIASLKTNIQNMPAQDWTPLSEAYYEVTRYFRGLNAFYNGRFYPGVYDSANSRYNSPIQYRCQKNYIIALTDGAPSYDLLSHSSLNSSNEPGLAQCTDSSCSNGLPNWDGLATGGANQYSDGSTPNTSSSREGSTYYLDDVAKFAWDIDAMPNGTQLDDAKVSFNDPAFPKQNIQTYTVGFLVENQMLKDAAEYGNGEFFEANSAEELQKSLAGVLKAISDNSFSSSALGANSTQASTDTVIYQARYTGDWQGFLYANRLTSNYYVEPTPLWEAGPLIPQWQVRNIFFSADESQPEYYSRSDLTLPMRFRNGMFTTAGINEYFYVPYARNYLRPLQYIRGRNDTNDVNGVKGFRERNTVLGDIINSSPTYVGPPNGERKLAGDGSFKASYQNFVNLYQNRPGMVFVGANDGMMHAFAAEQWAGPDAVSTADDVAAGQEIFAYIPSKSLGNLKSLMDPDYQHKFFVDGTPTVDNVYFFDNLSAERGRDKGWKTILLGGMRRGGQSIFALNITNPDDFHEETEQGAKKTVLWEFTDRNSPELGYTYSQPQIMRLADERWYAVFGNGYNSTESDGNASTTGDAVLFIVDLQTGNLKKMLSTQVGLAEDPTGAKGSARSPNGLSTPTGYDQNGDGIIEAIYAGDLYGNMWRFNVEDTDSDQWTVHKLFTACGADSCGTTYTPQPITSAPHVSRHPIVGSRVFFGTGKYIEHQDRLPANVDLQSFYGIFDTVPTAKPSSVPERTDLLEQTIDYHGHLTLVDGTSSLLSRVTSNNEIEKKHQGWFIDLSYGTGSNQLKGERVVTQPLLFDNRVAFVTMNSTSGDPCIAANSFVLMELNPLNGARFIQPIIDINNDGKIDEKDKVKLPGGGSSTTETEVSISGLTNASGNITVLGGEGSGGSNGNGSGGGIAVPDGFTPPKLQSKSVAAKGDTQIVRTLNAKIGLDPGRNEWRQIFQP